MDRNSFLGVRVAVGSFALGVKEPKLTSQKPSTWDLSIYGNPHRVDDDHKKRQVMEHRTSGHVLCKSVLPAENSMAAPRLQGYDVHRHNHGSKTHTGSKWRHAVDRII